MKDYKTRKTIKPDLHTPILSADKKTLKLQAKSKQESNQNRRSRCIEVRFCLSLLEEFKKMVDKVGVCKSVLKCL